MEFKEVKLSDVIANPYRDITKYPLDPEKVERLRQSVKDTGFWSNVVARPKASQYELAYGHHRIEAARLELGPNTKVHIIVQPLTDEQMLKMMAAENDGWQVGNSVALDLETVVAAAKILGLKKFGDKNKPIPGVGQKGPQIAVFLGWPPARVQSYAASLNAIAEGTVSRKAIELCESPHEAAELVRGVRSAVKIGKKVPFDKQVWMAKQAKGKVNPKRIIRILMSDFRHPLQTKMPNKNVENLLKEAAIRAKRLDVILMELRAHREALHNGNYSKSLEAFNVAASLQSVLKLTQEVFGKAQLEAPKTKKELANARS